MDARESRDKFKLADELYRAGQHQQALHILAELNHAYPNTKNVMYPAAMCLEKLGRAAEALPLCDQLILRYQDPRAQKLKDKIVAGNSPTGTQGPPDLDFTGLDASAIAGDILDIPATTIAYKPVEPDPFPWLKYSLIGLGVAIGLAVLIVPLMVYEPPPPSATPSTPGEVSTVSRAMIYGGAFAMLIIVSAFQTIGAYIALMLLRALPYEDFWSNAFNISVSMVVATLLESSFFGFFLTILWFVKAYDLGFAGICLLYIFRIVFFIVGFMIGAVIFAGSIMPALREGFGI